MDRQTDMDTHFYNVFAMIALEGMSKEEIEDILTNEIMVMVSQDFEPIEVLDALLFANDKAIEDFGIDIREAMNMPINNLTDIMGNSVPNDINNN